LRANCKKKERSLKKLEKLNQAKEQIEAIQREIDEMKNKKTVRFGKNDHSRTLDQTEEPRKKIFSREMESHSSWILSHHYLQGCKAHHGHQSSNQFLFQSTIASETLGDLS
jgi:FtsZ-binding cell division protein ZapB